MGYGSVHWRRAKVLSVAFLIYLDCKAVQKIGKCVSKSKKSELWKKAHERNAKRMLKLMIDLEGLWVKFGQYLSTLADVLPEAYISVLKQLQDSLPPRPLKEVCRTIETELGKTMGDMFKDFIKAPLATASIAQVHRATMSNGQEVVVKVRHEGIKDIILEDLKNVKSVVDWIAWAEPQFDFNPVIDEFCRETPKEFDFNLEAENARTVSNNLCHKVDNEDSTLYDRIDVLIPKVIQSTEKVLILEFMDGIRLNDHDALEAYGVDKQKLVEEITRAYAHQIYVDGFFNGDPHPGNFLVSKDPPHRPILLDFGLTKLISASMKQALAKMFLASAEGDHATLLSAFSEMGIRFREDLPNIAMHIATTYFCATEPAAEALEKIKAMTKKEKKKKNDKLEKKEGAKDNKYFNPVDAFPSDAVIFFRVLDVLRGVSSMLNVRIVYHDVIRPFAETALQGSITGKSASDLEWIYPTPVLSDAESKVRQLLIELGKEKILGIQVCAYKDGKVVIDTAAGMLGRYDPRAVQPDSLFPLFSATKGVTAGMLHWLANEGKVKMEENVASIWPSFSINGKEQVKVHHVLNHTSGLHTAMSDITSLENPLSMCDWKECLDKISTSTPVVEPGSQQLYHFLSFGWLCGGIIEHASGKPFQEILEEAIVHPLNVEGELYIGIPPGVETRLATLSVDMEDLKKLSEALTSKQEDLPTNSQPTNISDLVKGLPILFNTLAIRRAIIPAANGHSSARALARYYAALASNGNIPPPHTTTTGPQLGSHTHIPQFPLSKTSKNSKSRNETENTQKPLISKAESMFKNPNSKSRKEIENTQNH